MSGNQNEFRGRKIAFIVVNLICILLIVIAVAIINFKDMKNDSGESKGESQNVSTTVSGSTSDIESAISGTESVEQSVGGSKESSDGESFSETGESTGDESLSETGESAGDESSASESEESSDGESLSESEESTGGSSGGGGTGGGTGGPSESESESESIGESESESESDSETGSESTGESESGGVVEDGDLADLSLYTFCRENGNVYLTGYKGTGKRLETPADYHGESYDIYKDAFKDMGFIATIKIADCVKKIGENAFYGCKSLVSVTLGTSLTEIADNAFENCIKIGEVVNNSGLTISAGDSAYSGVAENALTVHTGESEIIEKDGLLFIFGDKSLSGIPIPDGVYTLLGYIGDESEITLKSYEDVGILQYTIYRNAFRGMENLTGINVETSETGISEIPYVAPILLFHPYAFADCPNFKKVNIDSIATWCSIAFYTDSFTDAIDSNPLFARDLYLNNELVTDLVIPEGVQNLVCSFMGCLSIRTVKIVGRPFALLPFQHCERLYEIYGSNSGVISNSQFSVYGIGSAVSVHTSETSKKVARGDFEFIKGDDGVNYLVGYTGDAEEITLPENFDGEDYAVFNHTFANKVKIRKLTVSDGVSKIGIAAFQGCRSLKEIDFGNRVKEIGGFAFHGCESLEKIDFGNGIEEIGMAAFNGCRSLKKLIIPDSVKKIEEKAFMACDGIFTVTIGTGLTKIAEDAFDQCYRLVEVMNNSEITVVGCKGYTLMVHSGESRIEEVGEYLFIKPFNGNNSLFLVGYKGQDSAIELPLYNGGYLYSIYTYAFCGNENITSIKIPSSVYKIRSAAFAECKNLTDITFDGTKDEWNAVSKDEKWDYGTGNYTVHCTDGDIEKA